MYIEEVESARSFRYGCICICMLRLYKWNAYWEGKRAHASKNLSFPMAMSIGLLRESPLLLEALYMDM